MLGATGRTGRLLAQELAGDGGTLLVGRRADAVEEVGVRTGLDTTVSGLANLTGVLLPGDVLVNCTGPYDVLGDQVVEAAIRAGATYVDVAGEPAFLRRLHGALGRQARRRGVTLVPAVGYEYLPGLLLGEEVLAALGGGDEAASVEIAYLADGGLEAGSASGRRSLVRALTRPTTTYADGVWRVEQVAARRGRFRAGGREHATVSLGGAEVWALPIRHHGLQRVDVHTGWFGPLGPLVSVVARLAGPARTLAVDRVLDSAVGVLGDGSESALARGTSRFVARVRDHEGHVIARREAVAGNAIVLAARLGAATAQALAATDLRDLPTGTTDPVAALGRERVARLAEWAGLVQIG